MVQCYVDRLERCQLLRTSYLLSRRHDHLDKHQRLLRDGASSLMQRYSTHHKVLSVRAFVDSSIRRCGYDADGVCGARLKSQSPDIVDGLSEQRNR